MLASAVAHLQGRAADGDIVDLEADNKKWIARGIYNSKSRIRVRLYTWDPNQQLDDAFWSCRIETAWQSRLPGSEVVGGRGGEAHHASPPRPNLQSLTSARMIFSEGDHLSGLIVDRYGDYLVLQVTAMAIALRMPIVIGRLVELAQPRGILVRIDPEVLKAEGLVWHELPAHDGISLAMAGGTWSVAGDANPYARHQPPATRNHEQEAHASIALAWGEMPTGPIDICDGRLKFIVDLTSGQKTGFYLDQRENRYAAAAYLQGRTVLDMFCYTGGFSLAAAWLGASDVLGVDSSSRALDLARQNAAINGFANIRFETGEAFETLQRLAAEKKRFGAVILDPPKFAHSRQKVDHALRAYYRLNRLALDVLSPGGILVTCSCSGHVSRDDFFQMLAAVAQQSGRDLQVLEQRGASADHPVSVTCPESEYLKCFICRVGGDTLKH